MNVLSILETDFIEICNAIVSGSLASLKISFKNEATVCKYAVPVGYPDSPSKNFEVFCNPEDHNLYLAAVQKTAGGLIATGSRTAAFVGINQKIGIAELAKFSGATGTFAAHKIAFPKESWTGFSDKFIREMGLKNNPITTQIEPNDSIAELLHAFVRINNILTDMCVDIWLYISRNIFTQTNKAGEVGSSTMPHGTH